MSVNLGLFQSVVGYRFGSSGANGFIFHSTAKFIDDGYIPGWIFTGYKEYPVYIRQFADGQIVAYGQTQRIYEGSNTPGYVTAYTGFDAATGTGVNFFRQFSFYEMAEECYRYAEDSEWASAHIYYGPNPITGGMCNVCNGFAFVGAKYPNFPGRTGMMTQLSLYFYFDNQLDKIRHNGRYDINDEYYWELKTTSGFTVDVASLVVLGGNFDGLTRRAVSFWKSGEGGLGYLEMLALIQQGEDAVLTKKPKQPGKSFTWRSA